MMEGSSTAEGTFQPSNLPSLSEAAPFHPSAAKRSGALPSLHPSRSGQVGGGGGVKETAVRVGGEGARDSSLPSNLPSLSEAAPFQSSPVSACSLPGGEGAVRRSTGTGRVSSENVSSGGVRGAFRSGRLSPGDCGEIGIGCVSSMKEYPRGLPIIPLTRKHHRKGREVLKKSKIAKARNSLRDLRALCGYSLSFPALLFLPECRL
jgi:hypothetical protein